MTFRFMRIPYSKPPVGKLRFQHAVEPENPHGAVIDATRFEPACMQLGYFQGNDDGLNPWDYSEEYLYLNVWTQLLHGDATDQTLKPVLVWVRGDGESQGTGADPTFDGDSLVSRGDVVLVTINYRLNVFGSLSLDDGIVKGNYALSDQIAALHWVQKHIKSFGRNPDQVTLFGQSAGGGFTIGLSVSPKARGMFHNALVQSGSNGGASKASTVAEAQIPIVKSYRNGNGVGTVGLFAGIACRNTA